MSLNAEEIAATKSELQANFDLLGYSVEKVAENLHTTPEKNFRNSRTKCS